MLSSIKATWDSGASAKASTADMLAEYGAMMDKPGLPARRDGDTNKAFKHAETVIEAEHDFPLLAHAPMEPHSVMVHHAGSKALINAQMQTFALGEVVRVLGVKAENVTYKTPYLGGGFGRRGTTNYVIEGLHVAKDEAWPVMMIWSREDDIKGGWYRPMYKNRARLALDPKGNISALEVKIVGQQLMKGTYLEAAIQNGIEGPQTEGIINHPYAIDSHDIQVYSPDSPIHGQWWRSVGHTHSAPTIDGLIDEAAFALGEDPLPFRIRHLENLRHISALEAVAKRSGWDKRVREKNVGYGISVIESFGSVCAQVARVRVTDDDYRVEKVWCAIDCGFAFNPLNVENQMISAINFALGALKYSEIMIASGACVQGILGTALDAARQHEDRVLVRDLENPADSELRNDLPEGEIAYRKDEATFSQRIRSPFRLLILGAGPGCEPLAAIADTQGWTTTVADLQRSRLARIHHADHIEALTQESGTVLLLRGCDGVVIMSHAFDSDATYLDAALEAGVGHIGVMGPKKRTGMLLQSLHCRIALHDLPVTPLFNPRFHDGIGSSIASGVSQIPPQTHLLIMLCDQPLIPMTHFRALIRAATEQPEKIIASHYHGRPGVPAIFPALYHSALMQLTGDRGAKGLLDSPACLELPLSHADALDVDTAEAWATVLRERGLFAGAQRSMD